MTLFCTHFVLSLWLWNITWGSNHIPFNIIISIFLYKMLLGLNIVPSVLMALISQIAAFILLTIIAVFAVWYIGVGGGPESFSYVPQPQHATLLLGLSYTVLQVFFFMIIRKRYHLPMKKIILATIVSNNLAVLISWLLLSID